MQSEKMPHKLGISTKLGFVLFGISLSFFAYINSEASEKQIDPKTQTQQIEDELNEFEAEEFPEESDVSLEQELEEGSEEDEIASQGPEVTPEEKQIEVELKKSEVQVEKPEVAKENQIETSPKSSPDSQNEDNFFVEEENRQNITNENEQETTQAELEDESDKDTEPVVVEKSEPVVYEYSDSSQSEQMNLVNPTGKVSYEYGTDPLLSYKERRKSWSKLFKLDVEQLLPDQYRSQLDSESYDNIYGTKTIPIVSIQFGVKKNFNFASIGVEGFAGYGELFERYYWEDKSKVTHDSLRGIKLIRYGLSGSLFLDGIFPEPYVAPYISGQIFQYQLTESEKLSDEEINEKKSSTGYATGFSIGALIQLNWINKIEAMQSYRQYGIENTYLDLYLTTRNTSSGTNDPSLQSSASYGAGLRIEY